MRRMATALAAIALAAGMAVSPAVARASEFTDVRGHWAETSGVIDGMVDKGLITGYPDGRFGPDDSISRAQVVTIMWRAAGSPEVSGPHDFSDVDYGSYYGAAVEWAEGSGVVGGYPDGRFGPNDPITREQLATILLNYHESQGGASGAGDVDRLTKYPDGSKVSGWAKDAVAWSVECGVMGDGQYISATSGATRAEACKMLLVYLNGGNWRDELLKAHFIDVGQGDSCFVELPNGQTMLIDAGTAQYGSRVVGYVRGLGYDSIDYVVATHPDADHIGGMSAVLGSLGVGTFYMPDCASTTQTYEGMLDALADSGAKVVEAKAGVSIVSSGDLNVRFVLPVSIQEGSTNENSAVIWINYGGRTYYLTGDADSSDLASAALGHADVLKVSHHGSSTGTSTSLLNRITPDAAVISVGAGNSYGHPTASVLSMLYACGADVYRTDAQGTVTSYTDTDDVWFSTSPTAKPTPEPTPEPTPQPTPQPTPDPTPQPTPQPGLSTIVYVTKTGSKYHYSWCPTLSRSKNLRTMTAAQAKAQGLGACKVCNPPA